MTRNNVNIQSSEFQILVRKRPTVARNSASIEKEEKEQILLCKIVSEECNPSEPTFCKTYINSQWLSIVPTEYITGFVWFP
jgi:hypothetical protein